MGDYTFELLLSSEELDGLRERFKGHSPTSFGNRLIATIDQRDRVLASQILKLAVAVSLLEEHQTAHGTALNHLTEDDPVAQDWRIRRDSFLEIFK